jgi:hypothetical protein
MLAGILAIGFAARAEAKGVNGMDRKQIEAGRLEV